MIRPQFSLCCGLHLVAPQLHIRKLPEARGVGLGGVTSTPSLCGKLAAGRGVDVKNDRSTVPLRTCGICFARYELESIGADDQAIRDRAERLAKEARDRRSKGRAD